MDYSLLVFTMEFDDDTLKEFKAFKETQDFLYYDKHIFESKDSEKIAHIVVIIDYLQTYNFKKKMETNFKNLGNEDDISCVPPDQYAARFAKFITNITTY
jgi:1-phosphatidylinositol-4-phosphate 5-kinase